jgi:hypothetical protein
MTTAAQPKPKFRTDDQRSRVLKLDPLFEKPEVVYRFSNGAEKVSTDRTQSGVYRRP